MTVLTKQVVEAASAVIDKMIEILNYDPTYDLTDQICRDHWGELLDLSNNIDHPVVNDAYHNALEHTEAYIALDSVDQDAVLDFLKSYLNS